MREKKREKEKCPSLRVVEEKGDEETKEED